MSALPQDYVERVYAGVLGKVIGVYLGRPFEGWTYERIQEQLGDITNYVHEQLDQLLIVTDDDISGTFTFARALADNGYDKHLQARAIGETWLNYLIEERTILWWGGLGNSTEHTAYLRLKNGIAAPQSGSMELNGKVVAEQIGAQIFIDGWAMVSPGDAAQAARLAEQAARVSHDGEAVYGAIVLAVMEAMAFVEPDTDKLIDTALEYIPRDCVIRRLIDDVRAWHAQESDWRATREQLAGTYGYDKYGGNCHMVPNHGLIMHSLLHGNDDFAETMKIINTCGWDTDCNSGNVGCLMGIKNGLAGIDHSPSSNVDWRGPVADRIYIPTADPTWGISDCARESMEIVNTARAMHGEPALVPKDGAQFHFALPGSVQGFMACAGEASIVQRPIDDGVLEIVAQTGTRVGSPVFAPSKEVAKRFETRGYALLASPRIYAGQTIEARVSAPQAATGVRLYVAFYGATDAPTLVYSDAVTVGGDYTELTLQVPSHANPVFEVGLDLEHGGTVQLERLGWRGEPEVTLSRPAQGGTMWRRAWVNGVDNFVSWVEPIRLLQNSGRGLLIQGTREWRDYTVSADVTPHLAQAAGIAARVQGMRRYYALYLKHPDEVCLVRVAGEETVLASAPFAWQLGATYQLSLSVAGEVLHASVDGQALLEARDNTLPVGGIALLIEEGRTGTDKVSVTPN
ncbi:MAG: ADP-ribosylglycohydrolase family protein [Pseudomonadota bacterium]